MNKVETQALDFLEYVREHPDERFWQALRNWSKTGFIYRQDKGQPCRTAIDNNGLVLKLEDTYYIE